MFRFEEFVTKSRNCRQKPVKIGSFWHQLEGATLGTHLQMCSAGSLRNTWQSVCLVDFRSVISDGS